ncbi:MAG: UDP-2,3-diacylglucosamine diphosphatase LpxI [Pseudomonadota bacterium]
MLALIAGSGQLPAYVAAAPAVRPYIAALEGFLPDDVVPDHVFRVETLGTLIASFKERGIRDVCFVGAIRRPAIDPTRLDAATSPLVPRLMAALDAGDDGALRVIIDILGEAGIATRGAHEIAPELLPPAGALSTRVPEHAHERDIARAAETVAALGARDIGQGCVVRGGQVLAVEATPGTDWMLESLTRFDARGGVLYKAPKPIQDLRVDMPVIGANTVQEAARAGLAGIAIAASGVMVIDHEACRHAADAAGLFLWVQPQ